MKKVDPTTQDGKAALIKEMSIILDRYQLTDKELRDFILLNSSALAQDRSARNQREQDLLERRANARELLRRHFKGETYREICVDLDINPMTASQKKNAEMKRIWDALQKSDNLRATVESLAKDYGLSPEDIVKIHDIQQSKQEGRRYYDEAYEAANDEEMELIEW